MVERPRRRFSANILDVDSIYDVADAVSQFEQVAVPIRFIYRGIEIRILEVSKVQYHDHTDYFVVVQFKHGERITRPFTIYCNSIQDFIHKLRIELIRFRLFNYVLQDTLDTVTIRQST